MARRRGLVGMSREHFEKRWLRVFGDGIPAWQLKRYVKGQYIWHVFSWKLLGDDMYLTGEAAMAAFAQVSKENACCIQPFEDPCVMTLPAELRAPDNIDRSCIEVYVVGQNWQWTYIKTHEGDLCGPYYMCLAADNVQRN